MAAQKTKPTQISVESFLDKILDEGVRDDCYELLKIMKRITGSTPKMWGPRIVGFGNYHYKYDSGHEGDACLTGFSPRKQNLTLYVMPGFTENSDLLAKLGKYKTGKGCLYIKRLSDVNLPALEHLIQYSVNHLISRYPPKS
jgi:hypothetical protein